MQTLRTIRELRAALEPSRAGSTVGLVPTMGALHAGHVALFDAARAECDVVVASLFVNPAQFDERRRVDAYPRDLAARRARRGRRRRRRRSSRPSAEELYPPGFATWVEPAGAADGLEGEHRPGHFRGVATVCVKLFAIVRPRRRVLRAQGRAAGRGREAGRPRPRSRAGDPRRADRARRRRARALVAQRAALARGARRGRSRCRARSRRATPSVRARCSPPPGSSPTTSPSPTSTGRRSRSRRASARPA